MKVTKKGIVKLEPGEVRAGNFFFKEENEHIKVTDLNSVFSFRVSRRMPLGIWLENIIGLGEKGLETLRVYASTLWSFFSVAPDDDFILDTLKATDDALHRHPDWYGIKADATDEEHDEAAREVREMTEFESEVKGMIEKEDGDEKKSPE